jgi:predicted dehydrogenase
MRWGFLGIGRVTPRMVSAIRAVESHDVVAAAARNSELLDQWGQQHSVSRLTDGFFQLCASPEIDAVYVALPPSLHRLYCELAAREHKVILCEKPVVTNHAEACELADVIETNQASIHHATGFPFHPRSLEIRRIVQSGRLGKILRVTVAISSSHILNRGRDHRTDPELGGGCLFDLGWYCAYATLWFTGRTPRALRALGAKHPTHNIWTSAQAVVDLGDGAFGHWDCGFDAAGRKWIEIAGSEASLICDDFLRPFDPAKPRFWIHGHDGKASCEIVGENVFQEAMLIQSIQREPTDESREAWKMAIETQRILDDWNSQMTPS